MGLHDLVFLGEVQHGGHVLERSLKSRVLHALLSGFVRLNRIESIAGFDLVTKLVVTDSSIFGKHVVDLAIFFIKEIFFFSRSLLVVLGRSNSLEIVMRYALEMADVFANGAFLLRDTEVSLLTVATWLGRCLDSLLRLFTVHILLE